MKANAKPKKLSPEFVSAIEKAVSRVLKKKPPDWWSVRRQ